MQVAFIGGGNMAVALIAGLLRQGMRAESIRVVEHNEQAQQRLRTEFGVSVVEKMDAETLRVDVIVLAVKPQQLSDVAATLRAMLTTQVVVSIAAGVRIASLSSWLGDYATIVRAMPNTPAMVGAGVTALFAAAAVTAAQRLQAGSVLEAAGSVLWLAHEDLMDAVTAVSGSGPAYVFLFMEAMQQAGVELGLTADAARQLTLETFLGAAKLAASSSEEVAQLRARVTSKGGTTEQAILTMQARAVPESIVAAVHAAAQRSKNLGEA
ncbi:MAG: pyrroline-5-carboxylate reductase [Sulfuriferula sp.]